MRSSNRALLYILPAALGASTLLASPARGQVLLAQAERGHGKRAHGKKARSPEEEATAAFLAGQAAFEKKNYKIAAEDWKKAFDIVKDPGLLYNIGQAYEKSGDKKDAVAFYRQYVSSQPTPADAAQVSAHIDELSPKPIEVATPTPTPPQTAVAPTISVAPASAPTIAQASASAPAVAQAAASEPAIPQKLNSPFFDEAEEPASKPVAPVATNPALPAPLAPPPAGQRGGVDMLAVGAWAGVGVTVACGTAAAIFALEARQDASDIDRLQAARNQNGSAIDYSTVSGQYTTGYSHGQTFSQVATGLAVASGAAAVATAGLFVLDSLHDRDETPPPAHRSFAISPVLGPGFSAISAGGMF